MIRTQSMRERVSFLIDQMDDVEAIPSSSSSSPPPHLQYTSGSVDNDGRRDNGHFQRLKVEKGWQHDIARNRENIHPQLEANTCQPNQQIPLFETPGEKDQAIKKPPMYTRKKSLHRRDSTASLPSPAEIGASPFSGESMTPQQKNVSFCPSILPPHSLYGPEERESTSQASQSMVPKSLHLTSGFR